VAHFTNEDLVDDDLVLSVFGSRLLTYWKYAKDYILPLQEIPPSSLRLAELRWLCKDEYEKGIRGWLQSMNTVEEKRRIEKASEDLHDSIRHEVSDQLSADIAHWFRNREELHRRLKREYLRSHPRMNKT